MTEKKEFSLFFENNRLKTFKNWPFKAPSKCTKEKMAAAGFYFKGKKSEPDLVCCFVCFKELDGWEEDDDPWTEHSRRGECDFIKLNKKEDEMTVLELHDLIMKRQINLTKRMTEKKLESFRKLVQVHGDMLNNS